MAPMPLASHGNTSPPSPPAAGKSSATKTCLSDFSFLCVALSIRRDELKAEAGQGGGVAGGRKAKVRLQRVRQAG